MDVLCRLKDLLHSPEFQRRHKTSPSFFTRGTGLLHFPVICLLLLNYFKQSLQTELDHFFQAAENDPLPLRRIGASAFCQARRKVAPGAFRELNTELILGVDQTFPLATWHGHRLVAIDGTAVRLVPTPEVLAHFHPACSDGVPLATATEAYDVLNRFVLHAALCPHGIDERDLALEHMHVLLPGDLVLLDRGYPAFWFLAWLRSQGIHFCTRVSDPSWRVVTDFLGSGRREALVALHPTAASLLKCRQHDLAPDPLSVRLIRVTTPSGETEILMTSLLDSQAYPADEFGDLYHRRWGVEENIKELKTRLQVENFSGKSVLAVEQDFYAKVLDLNLKALLVFGAQVELDAEAQAKAQAKTQAKAPTKVPKTRSSSASCKPKEYRINNSYALSALKNTLVQLFDPLTPLLSRLRSLFDLFKSNKVPVRSDRHFPRKRKLRDQPLFFIAYKVLC